MKLNCCVQGSNTENFKNNQRRKNLSDRDAETVNFLSYPFV